MSSESLMSLREHRLLFSVLPVPASVRPESHTTTHRQHETEASYSKCQHVLLWRPREAVKHSSALKWHWPDLGPFSVEVPQTLVLLDSTLFLIGPESWAGFDTSRGSSKEETIHSLLSSRSVYCQQVHYGFSIMDHFCDDSLHFYLCSIKSKQSTEITSSYTEFLNLIRPLW